jgi:predicted DNA-binding transcriptional regulator AlpA
VKPSSPTPTSTSSTTPAPAAIGATAGGITPELLTERQAAELLGMGSRTLWRHSRSGTCPAPVKIGRGTRPAVRYRRAELLQWIQGGCKPVDGKGNWR